MRWLALLLLGCGSSPAADGGIGDASIADASFDVSRFDASIEDVPDTGAKGTCPTTRPAIGTTCTNSGTIDLLCEYDTTYFPRCIERCDQDGTWKYAGLFSDCMPFDAGAPVCPNTYPSPGVMCASAGECNYQEGSCLCASSCGGPQAPGASSTWLCSKNSPTCPVPRPRFGEACTMPGQNCKYTLCCGGSDMTCANGIWQGTAMEIGCP